MSRTRSAYRRHDDFAAMNDEAAHGRPDDGLGRSSVVPLASWENPGHENGAIDRDGQRGPRLCRQRDIDADALQISGADTNGRLDLRPLRRHMAATEMLLRARGHLNLAFRAHGLCPCDVMEIGREEIDDPAAFGTERASARFADAFTAWADEMAVDLIEPVMKVLAKTHAALLQRSDSDEAGIGAVLIAHRFLSDAARLCDA